MCIEWNISVLAMKPGKLLFISFGFWKNLAACVCTQLALWCKHGTLKLVRKGFAYYNSTSTEPASTVICFQTKNFAVQAKGCIGCTSLKEELHQLGNKMIMLKSKNESLMRKPATTSTSKWLYFTNNYIYPWNENKTVWLIFNIHLKWSPICKCIFPPALKGLNFLLSRFHLVFSVTVCGGRGCRDRW